MSEIKNDIEKVNQSNNDNAESLSNALKEESDNIVSKIGVIESQNKKLALGVDNLADSKNKNEICIQTVKKQCDEMQKEIANIRIQSHNIEGAVNAWVKDYSNLKIIESINGLISEIRKDLENSVSGINEEILDTQIRQEQTNSQLDKLFVLLKSLDGTSDGKKSGKTNGSKQLPPNSGAPLSASASVASKANLNPNRIETIVDKETQNIVYNQYIDDKLIKSTMKNKKGILLYELEYVNDKIVRSRNYDSKGNLNIEQTYYDNGQVHYRNETTKNGRNSTEFDRNGNKKS